MSETAILRLKSTWIDDGSDTGQVRLSLSVNTDFQWQKGTKLAFTSLTRIPPQIELIGAISLRRIANYHEVAPLPDLVRIDTSNGWDFIIPVLSHRPGHCTDGPSSAFLILPNGEAISVECDPLWPEHDQGPSQTTAAPLTQNADREGRELGLLPRAKHVEIKEWAETAPAALRLPDNKVAAKTICSLYARLYPSEANPFEATQGGLKVVINPVGASQGWPDEAAYRLTFRTRQGHD